MVVMINVFMKVCMVMFCFECIGDIVDNCDLIG